MSVKCKMGDVLTNAPIKLDLINVLALVVSFWIQINTIVKVSQFLVYSVGKFKFCQKHSIFF